MQPILAPNASSPIADQPGPSLRLEPDRDQRNAWALIVDGTPQSHVQLDDPTKLDFEYMRRIAFVLDSMAPTGAPLTVLHLGAGALTMARYVHAMRPGSPQRAVELDADLIDLVRRELPLPPKLRIRIRQGDARAAIDGWTDASADVVISDVFAGARVPASCVTRQYTDHIARVLRPAGVAVLNVGDGPPLKYAKSQAATLLASFEHVVLMSTPDVLRGRRFGNIVFAASQSPLPEAVLSRRCASDPVPARVVAGADLTKFVSGAPVLDDSTAEASPPPPPDAFTRRRK